MLQQCAATTREQNNSIEEATQVEEDRVSMDSGDPGRRWTSLKERLGFKGMGCCGSRRRPTSSSFSTLETLQENPHTAPPLSSGMNLAMALAAERNSREEKDEGPATEVKTLMRLIEETDGVDWRKKRRRDNKGADTDWLCCVCMERSKGAAFIPCGHTFCRVCSREMWVNRGTCPLCNRSILEILDIFWDRSYVITQTFPSSSIFGNIQSNGFILWREVITHCLWFGWEHWENFLLYIFTGKVEKIPF